MQRVIPVCGFLLALIASYFKSLHIGSHSVMAKLFTIDAVEAQIRSDIVSLADNFNRFALVLGVMSAVIAATSIRKHFCNKAIGVLLLAVSVLSVAFSVFVFA